MTTLAAEPVSARRPTPLGGFSLGFLRVELRRMLRNRRTMIFTLLIPPLFFVIFGLQSDFRTQSYGSGNVTGYVMVSMAVYGAMLATTSGGAMVAIERAQGWSRQLRLTPLRPVAYIATKVAVAMVLGLVSVTAVFVVGAALGAHLTPVAWVSCFLLAWLTSLVFAAFGLFVGYLLPSENVMQLLGPVLAVLSFAGGLFIPLHGWFDTVSRVFPTNGVATLSRIPFGDSSAGSIALGVLNVVVWTALFIGGSALLFRRDTAR
ncbi:putative ABC transporter permease protein [Nocardia brasiliensis NBRC 14402]|uniref:ABC transporter permease n=1 Tax=Nocardia brasiliensis TaxID=37326 RepID=UPI0002EEE261|nr:ABC transporter permease [Nocardia brasiliensis]ASF09173.1 ABC transporter permease [Nocardia brasiliensis]GAJ85917.1 putative ABC transporter permease protein [Nocardia brasiliensis NBRC 14402]SUB40178.1 ABC-type transport system involved in multi-copper enzyme maturation, permease component [Nocardia brasiliensis]